MSVPELICITNYLLSYPMHHLLPVQPCFHIFTMRLKAWTHGCWCPTSTSSNTGQTFGLWGKKRKSSHFILSNAISENLRRTYRKLSYLQQLRVRNITKNTVDLWLFPPWTDRNKRAAPINTWQISPENSAWPSVTDLNRAKISLLFWLHKPRAGTQSW